MAPIPSVWAPPVQRTSPPVTATTARTASQHDDREHDSGANG